MGAHNTMGSLKLFKHCCAALVTPQEIPHVLHRKVAPQVTSSLNFPQGCSTLLSPLLGYARGSTFWIRKRIQLSGIDLIFPLWLKFPVLLKTKRVVSLGASPELTPGSNLQPMQCSKTFYSAISSVAWFQRVCEELLLCNRAHIPQSKGVREHKCTFVSRVNSGTLLKATILFSPMVCVGS